MRSYLCWVLMLVLLAQDSWFRFAGAQVDICQSNCESSDRLSGPILMPATRTHPWKQTVFPTVKTGFCKMGCQLFFAEFPRDITCKRMCDYYYRSQETVGYSDIVENAKLECKDGCDIALQVCQPGFYCISGEMMPCAPGKFREAVKSLSIISLEATQQCTLCPPGRYRKRDRGKSADDCTKCPIGKFANIPGSVLVSDCKRCPSGKNAEESGMAECTCITEAGDRGANQQYGAHSCEMKYTRTKAANEKMINYYTTDANGQSQDFYRETIPFIGRW